MFVPACVGRLGGVASRRGRTSAARGAALAGSGPCGPTALVGLRTLGVRTLGCASRAAAQRRPAPAAAGAPAPGAESFLADVLGALRKQIPHHMIRSPGAHGRGQVGNPLPAAWRFHRREKLLNQRAKPLR